MVEAMVAVGPGAVLKRDAIVGARLDLEPAVLVMVEPVALDQVARTTVEVDSLGGPLGGPSVAERLVVLHRRAGHAAGEVDPVVVVVRYRGGVDQDCRAPHRLDPEV